MNYARHYQLLIDRARTREPVGYVERHHVVPRCLGGGDEPENIVRLTPEEHYLAHQLLVKMHPGHKGLIWSAMAMTNGAKINQRSNKRYGWLRRQFVESIKESNTGIKRSSEAREKMRAAKLGKSYVEQGRILTGHSAETKAKMSAAARGKPKSPEHRVALAVAKIGNKYAYGHRLSESVKNKIAEAKGRLPIEEMVKLPLSKLSRGNRERVKHYRQSQTLSVMNL